MSELPQGFAIQCDRCHKLLLDCKCHLADLRPSHAVCASCFRVAERCDCPEFVTAVQAPAKGSESYRFGEPVTHGSGSSVIHQYAEELFIWYDEAGLMHGCEYSLEVAQLNQGRYFDSLDKPKPVPLPTPFSCTVPIRVGRRMTALLIDQRVPFAVEYLRGEIFLAVPRTFAVVLTAAQATAETDLAAGLFQGGDQ